MARPPQPLLLLLRDANEKAYLMPFLHVNTLYYAATLNSNPPPLHRYKLCCRRHSSIGSIDPIEYSVCITAASPRSTRDSCATMSKEEILTDPEEALCYLLSSSAVLLYHLLYPTCYHQPVKFASPCITAASPCITAALSALGAVFDFS